MQGLINMLDVWDKYLSMSFYPNNGVICLSRRRSHFLRPYDKYLQAERKSAEEGDDASAFKSVQLNEIR